MINISKSELAKDINAGMKREGIIEKYSTDKVKLTNGDVTKILKSAGLKIRKFKKPTFKVVDDTANFLVADADLAASIKNEAEQGNTQVGFEVTTEVVEEENNNNQ